MYDLGFEIELPASDAWPEPADVDDGGGMRIPLSPESLAQLAARVLLVQTHAFGHTRSCFKSGRKGCRYKFPLAARGGVTFVVTNSLMCTRSF